ncbi:MAG: hypothetical protein DRR19_26750 [Candidatus Parabeggiatoa sp. nov. 1]|nr:MAG: hypothetical protein DRR19_26750 [Gammaproteobacteria bacterium]
MLKMLKGHPTFHLNFIMPFVSLGSLNWGPKLGYFFDGQKFLSLSIFQTGNPDSSLPITNSRFQAKVFIINKYSCEEEPLCFRGSAFS